jgi:hypothetical protein
MAYHPFTVEQEALDQYHFTLGKIKKVLYYA